MNLDPSMGMRETMSTTTRLLILIPLLLVLGLSGWWLTAQWGREKFPARYLERHQELLQSIRERGGHYRSIPHSPAHGQITLDVEVDDRLLLEELVEAVQGPDHRGAFWQVRYGDQVHRMRGGEQGS